MAHREAPAPGSGFHERGIRLHGGRWNSTGRPVVCVSESRALATLEILTGLRTVASIPRYVLVGVAFDEDLVSELALEELDAGWHLSPPTFATQSIGDAWLDAGASAVLGCRALWFAASSTSF